MCVIVYKPKGIALPDEATLRRCFITNSDGAGFMYPIAKRNKVRISKGYLSLASFLDAVEKIPNVKDIPLVMHFRISTQGLVNGGNTHPFPISDDHTLLTAHNCIADVALAHNGIIDLTSSWGYKKEEVKYSDTYYFVRDYATLICDSVDWWENPKNIKLLKRLADSKLAVMGSDGHVELIGDFIFSEDDCFYSNDYHDWNTYSNRSSYSHAVYELPPHDDDADEDGFYWEYDDKLGEYVPKGMNYTDDSILAAFAPPNVWVVDEDEGKVISTNDDIFVVDKHGYVYLYDDFNNCIYYLHGASIVDDNWDDVKPDEDIFCKFTVATFVDER